MLRKRAERNIKAIIIDTYEEEAEFQDEDFDDFYIFVSTITAYGYSTDEIEEFATKYGIKISPDDKDPDDEYDTGLGSLEVNKAKIEELKKLKGDKNMTAKLENGTVKVTNYDDGIGEGIRLVLTDKDGNESEIALDILKDTGEARAIIYKVGSDEPDTIISLN